MALKRPKTVRLADYTAPPFLVDTVELHFELGEEHTSVRSRLQVRRNPAHPGEPGDLVLDGRELELVSVSLDGERLSQRRYREREESLAIVAPPAAFTLETEVRIRPQENTSLEGLYKSRGNFCTQCEAEGFRKITYFPDRPDVMARYSATIAGDRERYPVLLSNGNDVDRGVLDGSRHWVRWEDPFAKPSYLFALVAGDLACHADRFVTASGREVALRIYVEHHNADKCAHAMASLKRAMRWDEEVFGLEYDLDTFMIVAVDDFNMGAMENKGLNIFNSKYVLARPETATDQDYAAIEGVVAHEYFHNWTGNRITCRDWFQLSLKEGLTVFRDQEFSSDMSSRAVKRIQDARTLRTHQFAEDAGPMAHPVRPDSYIEISNFYTVTVYNKGAEVIRMIHTLLGAEGFRRGMALYIERHDGQAVTTEDFVCAMEDATGTDLTQFRRWYTQAGTPTVNVEGDYDADTRTFTLNLRQSCPPTPDQPDKAPFHVPLRVALVDREGRNLALQPEGEPSLPGDEVVLSLRERAETFRFKEVAERPVVSVARGFSAPIRVAINRNDEELAFLAGHDTDSFNRWDAMQEYASQILLRAVAAGGDLEATLPDAFLRAFERTLLHADLDKALVAQALSLPAETYLANRMEVIDPQAIHDAHRTLRAALARALGPQLRRVYRANLSNEAYRFDSESAGRRALKNLCLGYLMESGDADARSWCRSQFHQADNMTDTLAALGCLVNTPGPERSEAIDAFERRWRHDSLVLDKWFTLQAMSHLPDTLDTVVALTRHAAFDVRNPNKVRALVGAFCHGNQVRFHDAGGAGYRFVAERVIEIDPLNPQVAARLVGAFSRWRKFDLSRQAAMRGELERILAAPGLSKDTYEIASKTLG